MTYLILQNPGHNRVYYNSADKLALAELKLMCQRLSVAVSSIEIKELKGIRYLSFSTEEALSGADLDLVSKLSFVFALFQLKEVEGKECLLPITTADFEYIDSKISSLLKYQGKTNELFTKMMLNVALLASDFDYSDPITLFDPVCGKGTTLFEASIYGFDAYGIEIEQKPVHEASVFFKKFLENEHVKHSFEKRQIYGNKKSEAVLINDFKYAKTKEEFKEKATTKSLGIVAGNTQDAHKYFKKKMFNIIVGDLPYGIFHGNSAEKKGGSKTRNPSDLLNECLPEWKKVLKTGGTVVVAWNSFIVSRKRLSEVFSEHGFEVQTDELFHEFEHMVDRSIKRDIVVAKLST